MALDVDQQDILDFIGHDGLRVLWPDKREPFCYQGHHIQEMIDFALEQGRYVVEIQKFPLIGQDQSSLFQIQPDDKLHYRFRNHLLTTKYGVLILPTHAVAWDGTNVHDPNGKILNIMDIYDDVHLLFKVI